MTTLSGLRSTNMFHPHQLHQQTQPGHAPCRVEGSVIMIKGLVVDTKKAISAAHYAKHISFLYNARSCICISWCNTHFIKLFARLQVSSGMAQTRMQAQICQQYHLQLLFQTGSDCWHRHRCQCAVQRSSRASGGRQGPGCYRDAAA